MKRLTYRANIGGAQDIILVDKKSMKECLKWKDVLERLAHYEDLEEEGKIVELPCVAGDYALFSGGYFLPVIYVTVSQTSITVGCQNGIKVSMDLQYPGQCKGFYKTREEAEVALKKLKGDTTK